MDLLEELPPAGGNSAPRPRVPGDDVLRDIGGYRVTNDATSQAVDIPDGAEAFYVFAEAGDSHLDIGGAFLGTGGSAVPVATVESSLVIFEDVPFGPYPLAPGQRIACYGASGTSCNFRFLGRRIRR